MGEARPRRSHQGPHRADVRGARGAGAAAERESPAAARAGDPKKRGGLLRERASDTFALIHSRKATFPIATMCQVLGISASGYYAWCRRSASAHAQRDRQVRVLVRAAFDA